MKLKINLAEYLPRNPLTTLGKTYVEHAFNALPSRQVRSRVGNVLCRFPSAKMGCVMTVESRNELAVAYQLEHSPSVLAYCEQPPSLKICYRCGSGRIVGCHTTPDFLSLTEVGTDWLETKPEEALVRLAEKMPDRYIKSDSGEWKSPPAEEAAREYGFGYRIISAAEINPTLTRNLMFLSSYLRDDCPNVLESVKRQITHLVTAEPGITVKDLSQRVGAESLDDLWRLVAKDEIFVDFSAVALADVDRVRLFPNRDVAEALFNVAEAASAGRLEQDRWIARSPATTGSNGQEVAPRHEYPRADGELRDAHSAAIQSTTPPAIAANSIQSASAVDLQIANRRKEAISNPDVARAMGISARSIRRWQRAYRNAELLDGNGYSGLIPRIKHRGNRMIRLPEEVHALAAEIIDNQFLNVKRRNKKSAFGFLLLECERRGRVAPCYAWFAKLIKRIDQFRKTLAREGPRAAYKYDPALAGRANLNHGDFPWQITHIDHTLLDVILVDSESGQPLGRPWISLLFDAYSRMPLAVSVSFDPPSSRSCMMLVRDCVRRHQRLPESIVTDNGREFESVYYQSLLSRYAVAEIKRPPSKPRFGSVLERLLGTITSQLIHNLAGNTQLLKRPREATGSFQPEANAVWSLEEFCPLLEEYLFEFLPNQLHSSLGMTPSRRYEEGMRTGGTRRHLGIVYDQEFIIQTYPSTSKGTARVIPRIGVKIHHFYYWSDSFRAAGVEGTPVAVRYDPFDLSIAYAYVGKTWVKCLSQFHDVLAGRTEKELRLATMAHRQKRRLAERAGILNAKQLAEFIASAEGTELLLAQRRKDQAQARALSGATAGPATDPSPTAQPPPDAVSGDGRWLAPTTVYGEF